MPLGQSGHADRSPHKILTQQKGRSYLIFSLSGADAHGVAVYSHRCKRDIYPWRYAIHMCADHNVPYVHKRCRVRKETDDLGPSHQRRAGIMGSASETTFTTDMDHCSLLTPYAHSGVKRVMTSSSYTTPTRGTVWLPDSLKLEPYLGPRPNGLS